MRNILRDFSKERGQMGFGNELCGISFGVTRVQMWANMSATNTRHLRRLLRDRRRRQCRHPLPPVSIFAVNKSWKRSGQRGNKTCPGGLRICRATTVRLVPGHRPLVLSIRRRGRSLNDRDCIGNFTRQ